jgi:hypothetical protein
MGLFDGANNMFGPINEELKGRIVRYLHAPTPEGWDDIHGIIINDHANLLQPRTIWQAVIKVDATFPKTGPRTTTKDGVVIRSQGWKRYPDAITLARAIKAALVYVPTPEARTP